MRGQARGRIGISATSESALKNKQIQEKTKKGHVWRLPAEWRNSGGVNVKKSVGAREPNPHAASEEKKKTGEQRFRNAASIKFWVIPVEGGPIQKKWGEKIKGPRSVTLKRGKGDGTSPR